ncbi:MAG: SDR family NAD(P)-dependent oxidoreductase [Candidatus Nanopelagicales bacterium]
MNATQHDLAVDLTGRRAWVTGASRGLGRAIALGLLAAGADVAVSARSEDALATIADEAEVDPSRVLVVPVAVDDSGQVERAAAAIAEGFGRLDALVNCAGVSPTFVRAEDVAEDDWKHVLDVNLTGTFLCARAAARLMLEGDGGSIVNVSSIHARVGMARLAAYSASKGGAEALTRTLALEWADRGIRVNSVTPGYFATEMTEGLRGHDRWRDMLLGRIPLGRFGEPDELVPAVLFLVSDGARYITGSSISVDGGWTAA